MLEVFAENPPLTNYNISLFNFCIQPDGFLLDDPLFLLLLLSLPAFGLME